MSIKMSQKCFEEHTCLLCAPGCVAEFVPGFHQHLEEYLPMFYTACFKRHISHIKILKHSHFRTAYNVWKKHKLFTSLFDLQLRSTFLKPPEQTYWQTSCLFDAQTQTHTRTRYFTTTYEHYLFSSESSM